MQHEFIRLTEFTGAQIQEHSLSQISDPSLKAYAELRISYTNGDPIEIAGVQRKLFMTQLPPQERAVLMRLAVLMKQLRECNVSPSTVHSLLSEAQSAHDMWQAEAFFYAGFAHEQFRDYADAMDMFATAAQKYQLVGAKEKAVFSEYNSLSNEPADTWRPWLVKAENIYHRAKEIRSEKAQYNALYGVYTAHKELFDFDNSLKAIQKCVSLIEKIAPHSDDHHKALAIRCDLFSDMGNVEDAVKDYKIIAGSNFPTVRASARVIESKFGIGDIDFDDPTLMGHWVNNLKRIKRMQGQNNQYSAGLRP